MAIAAEGNGGLIAGVYFRVSTGRQEQEQTIQAQSADVQTAVKSEGNKIGAGCIFSDDGWTGELLARPGLDAMRAAAMEGRFQILYVYDRGRISRLYAHQEVVIEELENRGIAFRSLRDAPANTPEEKVLQAMQGVFQQYERVKIAERFRMAKLFKARQGVLINGQLPYGYTRVARVDRSPARALINEDQAKVVRQIRLWYGVDGLSIYRIIDRLHKLGVPPPKQLAASWRKTTVMRLLQLDAYHTGLVYFNKTEAVIPKQRRSQEKYKRIKRTSRKPRPRAEWLPIQVPPLVLDDGLYERIQLRLAEGGKCAPRNRKYNYLLVGRIFCGCGCRRVGDGYQAHHYYRCTERIYKYPVPGECRIAGVNAPALDAAVWGGLVSHLRQPSLLESHAIRWLGNVEGPDQRYQTDINRLREQIDEALEEEQRYIKAYGSGSLGFERFRTEMDQVKRRLNKHRSAQQELQSAAALAVKLPSAKELSVEASRLLERLDVEDMALVTRELIDKVVIRSDHEVEITAHLPVGALKVGEKHESGNINQQKPPLEMGEKHESGNLAQAIPFLEFRFTVPRPSSRKARIITRRDGKGRIVRSTVP